MRLPLHTIVDLWNNVSKPVYWPNYWL